MWRFGSLLCALCVALALGAVDRETPESLQPLMSSLLESMAEGAGNVTLPPENPEDAMVKSARDKRKFHRTVLPNGVDLLLVHQPGGGLGACAVDVNSGWWNDPKDIGGLAHFTEHLMFMGNNLVDEGGWETRLASWGGASNAFTGATHTNFFFGAASAGFDELVEMFSEFFKTPKFSVSSVDREIDAVNAEFVMHSQEDSAVQEMLLQHLANQDLNTSMFGWGNSKTLRALPAEELRTRVVEYWTKYFTAPNLRVVLLSDLSIPRMYKMAVKYFSGVRTGDEPLTYTPQGAPIPHATKYRDDSARVHPEAIRKAIVHSKSIAYHRDLSLMWAIPPQTPRYRTKSLEYVENLLGGESTGSLISTLRAARLANGI